MMDVSRAIAERAPGIPWQRQRPSAQPGRRLNAKGKGAVSGRLRERRPHELAAPRRKHDRTEVVQAAGVDEGDCHRFGFVAVVGRPNAGKSTLMNALVGQRLSIVTHKAQTTRHRVSGILSTESYQAVLIDTPGVIPTMRNIMEQRMMSAMQQAVRDADALVAIIDASKTPKEDFFILEPGVAMGLPVCVVLNKMDQVPPQEVAPMVDWFEATSNASSVLPVSALTGENLAELRAWVHGALPPGPAMYPEGDVSTASERFFVSEIIRERIYEQYDQEIPYMCTVNIVQFKERSRGKDLIVADVIVEQARHKGILVGRKGSAIKRLSASARLDIETFLGRPVYLELSVKEQKGWRDNDSSLERMGY